MVCKRLSQIHSSYAGRDAATEKEEVKVKADLGGKCERIVTHNDRAEERVKLYTFAVESLVRCGKKKKAIMDFREISQRYVF